MADLDHLDQPCLVVDRVHDAIVTLPKPVVALKPGKLPFSAPGGRGSAASPRMRVTIGPHGPAEDHGPRSVAKLCQPPSLSDRNDLGFDAKAVPGVFLRRPFDAIAVDILTRLRDTGRQCNPEPSPSSQAVAPPQLEPAPAVQPKQWRSVTMSRDSRAARLKSRMCRGADLATGISSI